LILRHHLDTKTVEKKSQKSNFPTIILTQF